MAAMGPGDRAGAGQQGGVPTTPRSIHGPDLQLTAVFTQSCVQAQKASGSESRSGLAASVHDAGVSVHGAGASVQPPEAAYSFRSPESVEMDEIMAAMVLTTLSCSPVVQSLPQMDPGAADMECGGGELSDSGSSGYWSWDHGNVSPAPSPSVPEVDSSPDEGLGEELSAKKPKSSLMGMYKCLWPSCGKMLTTSVGIKRHIRVVHLRSGSDQSLREEDFYYTKISCESPDAQQALGQATSCASPPGPELQIPPAPRPRSNSSSGPVSSRPSPLSQSAPSSFWQIHSEHLYQACSPVQVSVAPRSPGSQCWTPPTTVSGHSNTPMVKPRCRSVSVGEQWLQQNRLQPMIASPSRTHCSFRKGRGEAKKCRKVYGVERKDQWCTACRWKKACQRFPD